MEIPCTPAVGVVQGEHGDEDVLPDEGVRRRGGVRGGVGTTLDSVRSLELARINKHTNINAPQTFSIYLQTYPHISYNTTYILLAIHFYNKTANFPIKYSFCFTSVLACVLMVKVHLV